MRHEIAVDLCVHGVLVVLEVDMDIGHLELAGLDEASRRSPIVEHVDAGLDANVHDPIRPVEHRLVTEV